MQQLAKINWNSSEKVWGQKQMKRGRKLANTANRPNRAKRQNDPNFLLCGGLRNTKSKPLARDPSFV